MNRKEFIWSLLLGSIAPVSFYCTPSEKNKPLFSKTSPNSKSGHLLRDEAQGVNPVKETTVETLIIGAGISGLSCAYTLQKNGYDNYLIVELEEHAGGNSSYKRNEISAYPLGAHYLPIPNLNQPALINFLEEADIIQGYDSDKRPIYREEYLCHDPQERLFIKNYWQDGLIPSYSVPDEDKKEIEAFFSCMKEYQQQIGSDGKEAFCIPIKDSSRDSRLLQLDQIDFGHFITQKGWKSAYLHWYIDYCLRDDFGTKINETSAWMGIHYFASRKGVAANAAQGDILTWPEGNGKLMDALKKNNKNRIICNKMATQIHRENDGYLVTILNTADNSYESIRTQKLVMATPQFICERLLKHTDIQHPLPIKLDYSPWLIANITIKNSMEEHRGAPLSWDNVIYGSEGLGYVNANHQHLQVNHQHFVFTYYRPLLAESPSRMRKKIATYSNDDWRKIVLDDLKIAHPTIEKNITSIEIYTTGHSMPQPKPGVITEVLRAKEQDDDTLYFCHSDCSGYSIFEEAFYWGNKAAEHILSQLA